MGPPVIRDGRPTTKARLPLSQVSYGLLGCALGVVELDRALTGTEPGLAATGCREQGAAQVTCATDLGGASFPAKPEVPGGFLAVDRAVDGPVVHAALQRQVAVRAGATGDIDRRDGPVEPVLLVVA